MNGEHITIDGKLEHAPGCQGFWYNSYNMGSDTEHDVGYRCSMRCGAELSISVREAVPDGSGAAASTV